MALKNCKECNAQISDKATSCPQCGSPQPKKTSVFTWICAGILALSVIISIFASNRGSSHSEEPNNNKVPTAEDLMTLRQMEAYSVIKSSMKDPESAQINFYKGKPCGRVNGKNSFNGYTGYKRIVLTDKVNIESQTISNKDFLKLWKEHCEGVRFE
ncbi:zinc ribbon domain-containing protein [Acinetobacter sp. CFCC 10889]|uniref:zinc ribbon domain-containing protein n=1 Tax=Acinetobacter sp. CFCC 10889 TaxID=1775557 RepID=UPI000DD0AE89|nr:zinc ribbon domain-containing protein [Acinetobacter sp. CFCC 10889]